MLFVFLASVALIAQRPIVVKLSCGRSVGLYVRRPVQCIVEKWRIGSGCRLASQVGWLQGWGRYWGLAIGPREGVLLGAHLGRAIVTNGDFMAYVCNSAATRPSSQITLGKLIHCRLLSKTLADFQSIPQILTAVDKRQIYLNLATNRSCPITWSLSSMQPRTGYQN